MRIKMLKTAPGSIDGIRVSQYEAGAEYDLSHSQGEIDLALAFVGARLAVVVAETKPVSTYETKVIGPQEAKTFDPETAPLEEVRAFLESHGQKPHHKTGEAKLREMALEVATR